MCERDNTPITGRPVGSAVLGATHHRASVVCASAANRPSSRHARTADRLSEAGPDQREGPDQRCVMHCIESCVPTFGRLDVPTSPLLIEDTLPLAANRQSRWTRRVIVSLVIGFIANAGVVVYLSYVEPDAAGSVQRFFRETNGSIELWIRTHTLGNSAYLRWSPDLRPTVARKPDYGVDLPAWVDSHSDEHTLLLQRRGWPMECVWCKVLRDPSNGKHTVRGGIVAPPNWFFGLESRQTLLYFPVLSGLILNTLFYGTICCSLLWLLASANRQLERWKHSQRRRRNRCIQCDYVRTGLADSAQPCPECGHSPVGSTPRTVLSSAEEASRATTPRRSTRPPMP